MINLNQLRIFYHAAKNLSFTRAAQELYITQPAVTHQVKALEGLWNLKLFKKIGNRIYLTEEGKEIYEYSKKIFQYEREIELAIEDLGNLRRGILQLGTTKTLVPAFMPAISSFSERYPNIRILVEEGSSLDLIRSLLDSKSEIVIAAKVIDHPDICFVHFIHEELSFIVGPDHPLASKKTVLFEELSKEPILMKERGSGTRKLVNELFKKNNCSPNVLIETSNTEFIKQHVQSGEGVSFLVREAVSLELNEKKLVTVPIKQHEVFLDVCIAFLKNQPLSLPAKAFLENLEKLSTGDMPFIKSVVPSWRKHLPPIA